MHYVNAQIRRSDAAEHGVHIGPVAVDLRARRVDQLHHLKDAALEQAKGAWQREHDGRNAWAKALFEILQINPAVLSRGQADGPGGRSWFR